MKFKARITLKDYRQLSAQILLQNRSIKFLRYIAYFMGFSFLLSLTMFFEDPKLARETLQPVIFLTIPITLIILAFRYNAKKTFLSNKLFSDDIEFEVNGDHFSMTGCNFKTEKSMAAVFKIVELKDWFLLYESTSVANFIPKRGLSPDQLAELRELLKAAVGPQKIRLLKVKRARLER